MNTILIFFWVYAAMIAMAFWEAYSERRNVWNKGKGGWSKKILGYELSAYHFWLFYVMMPILITLPLIVNGWDERLFGILLSAYVSGLIIEDITWYIVNPEVKFKEFLTKFSDYYPWIKINKKKIIPVGYVLALIVAVSSWLVFWN